MAWSEPPTRAELFTYLRATDPRTGDTPPDDYDLALAVAVEQQEARCVTAPYTDSLKAAALKRAARLLAEAGAPLGVAAAGDFGAYPVMRAYDVDRLEAPYMRAPVA